MSYWITGENLNTARDSLAGCGTQSAGLSFGGDTGSVSAVTEHYNGSSWSSGGNLNTARKQLAGCGTQSAGLSFGGNTGYASVTEHYNGSSWSSGGNLNTARYSLAGCGTQSAGLSFGGFDVVFLAVTEHYNGSSWSSGGNLNTARNQLAGCGTQSAGLSFGGYAGSVSAVTEHYNGSSWSSGGNLNTARRQLAGCGTQSAGLSFGGFISVTSSSVTERYNGSSWSSGGNLNTARYSLAGCGTQSAGLSFGGFESAESAATEHYQSVTDPGPNPLNAKSDKGSVTSFSSIQFPFAAGDLIVVALAADSDVTGTISLDGGWSVGSTTTLSATNSGNVVAGVAYATVSGSGSAYASITISGLTAEAHVAAFYVFRASSLAFDKSASSTGSGSTAEAGPTAPLTQAAEIAIGVIGMEEEQGEKGTWTTGAAYVEGNYLQAGTAGGGGHSNISVFSTAELLAATTAQNVQQTATGSNDWAALVATFSYSAGGGGFEPFPMFFGGGV